MLTITNDSLLVIKAESRKGDKNLSRSFETVDSYKAHMLSTLMHSYISYISQLWILK